MLDFLQSAFDADKSLIWTEVLLKQLFAAVFGVLVALVYRSTLGNSSRESRALFSTLILLTLIISVISAVIGDNVARAFSLVGALSIVRFRTVVEDTRDTAFVILAVGVGMAVGAGHLMVPIILLPLAAATAYFAGTTLRVDDRTAKYNLTLRCGLGDHQQEYLEFFNSHGIVPIPVKAATVRQGSGIEQTFEFVVNRPINLNEIVRKASDLPSVTSVEIERRAKSAFRELAE